jgi:adenylosuccinate synthase
MSGPEIEACAAALEGFARTVSIVDSTLVGELLGAGPCVFEGAQGVLLDEWHGFHPYTTWSTTTFANADALLGPSTPAYRLGVLRTVTTRHGPGPLVTEDPALGIDDPNNPANPWQGPFRVGHFDAVAHRYALEVGGGIDGLALTHLDLASARPDLRLCTSYAEGPSLAPGPAGDLDRQERLTHALLSAKPDLSGGPVRDWPSAVSAALEVPIAVESWGPTASDKRVRSMA